MLDRAEILTRRKLDVLDGHVVLEVDPLAALGARPRPCRLDAIALVGRGRARRSAGSAASLMRLAQQPRQGEGSVGRADDADAVDRIARNERRQWFVEAQADTVKLSDDAGKHTGLEVKVDEYQMVFDKPGGRMMERLVEQEGLVSPEEFIRQGNMELLVQLLPEQSYPGYPPFLQRLHSQWLGSDPWNTVSIPNGPWWVKTEDYLGGPAPGSIHGESTNVIQEDVRLHPWFWAMVQNPDVGVVCGKGEYWHWGPNYTGDPIILRHDLEESHVLLVQRSDTGTWGLPGRFVRKIVKMVRLPLRVKPPKKRALIPCSLVPFLV